MKKMKWDVQKIKDIKQKEFGNFIEIDFSYNAQLYVLRINESDGTFIPAFVFHQGFDICNFCEGAGVYCSVLSKKRNEIFQHVVQENNIRFYWLYKEVKIQ